VPPTPRPPTPAPTTPPIADLRPAVREALAGDPTLAPLNLNVEQEGTTILVSGGVPSVRARYAVERVARSAPGVRAVDLGGVTFLPYIVKPGQGIAAVANDVYGPGVDFKGIAEANGIEAPYPIHGGQELVIPPPPW
jgi:hypothetical protein